MSTRDRIAIVFILLIVVICAVFVKVEAGAGIDINGVHIGCEYELAKFAAEHPYDFVTSETGANIEAESYKKWFRGETLNLHNVTSNCCSCGSNPTIAWSTAFCINHNQADSKGGKPWIVTLVEIEWDANSKCYKYQAKHGTGITAWQFDNRIKNVVRGVALGAQNDQYGINSGYYGSAMAREFYNIFKGRSDIINEQFTHSYKLNARK